MKIDYKKILNLNKTNIKKYINKQLFDNNYLFHYYILLNHLAGLKITKFPIYLENNDGLNGFHLAAKMENIDILKYLIKTYPEYIYNKTSDNNTFVYYLSEKSIMAIIKSFPNLDWNYLIYPKLLKLYFRDFSFNNIITLVKLLKIDNLNSYIYNIIYNENITTKNKIKFLDRFNDDLLNVKSSLDGAGLLLDSLSYNNKELFDYLVKRNIDYNYYTVIHTDNPLRLAIQIDIINNKKYYSKILLKKYIDNKHNFNYELNRFGDNIIHSILYYRLNRLNTIDYNVSIDYTIDTDILEYSSFKGEAFESITGDETPSCSNSDLWNQLNNDKISPLNLVIQLDYNIYSPFVKTKITQLNKDKLNKIDINEDWLKFINQLEIYDDKNNVEIPTFPYMHYTLFQSRFKDLSLFMLYLSDKYKDLLVPTIKSYLILNIKGNNLLFSDDILEKKQIFPWYISYFNENEFYIHKYLNNIIKSAINANKKYAIVFLSRNFITTLHANILFYDFIKMTVERFEPYGNIELSNIDDILEEELTWDTGLIYIRPSEYLKSVGFQTLSNENNVLNNKAGDLGGYCLAWCIWYIEMRMININIDPDMLVNKLISKLNNIDIKYSEYIRNYSNKINNYRIQYLLNIGIDNKTVSNMQYDGKSENMISNFILNSYDT
jgi:hypothetical protein